MACLVRLRAVGGLAPDHWARWGHAGGRFWVHRAGNLGQTADWRVFARRAKGLVRRGLVDVREAHRLHRVEVVEITPKFLEAMRRGQGLGVVAQVVLAELASGVAEVPQEHCKRRGTGSPPRGAARERRRDHASPKRIHSGEKGIAARGAALHGYVVHEDAALLANAVDVWRLANHQTAMINLHPTDVITHDEENVW